MLLHRYIRDAVASSFAPIGRHRYKGDLKPEHFVISGSEDSVSIRNANRACQPVFKRLSMVPRPEGKRRHIHLMQVRCPAVSRRQFGAQQRLVKQTSQSFQAGSRHLMRNCPAAGGGSELGFSLRHRTLGAVVCQQCHSGGRRKRQGADCQFL